MTGYSKFISLSDRDNVCKPWFPVKIDTISNNQNIGNLNLFSIYIVFYSYLSAKKVEMPFRCFNT